MLYNLINTAIHITVWHLLYVCVNVSDEIIYRNASVQILQMGFRSHSLLF